MPRITAKSICLIRLSSLGDIVHALAVVNGLRRGYPDASITWVLNPLGKAMIGEQPAVDKFILFKSNKIIGNWMDLLSYRNTLEFDLVILPQVSFKAGLVSACLKAKIKLGFDRGRSRELHGSFINTRIPAGDLKHAQDMMFDFLDYLEIPNENPEWNFHFTAEEIHWRNEFRNQFDKPIASFVVASSKQEKDWTPEGYAKVIDYVSERADLSPVLIGGPSTREYDIAKRICQLVHIPVKNALEKPIRHTLLQISASALVISPDTGPLHAAVAMKVPTIGLYGYSNPRRCGPYNRFQDLLIDKYNDSAAEDEKINRKTKPERMMLITPEEVIEKIEFALKNYVPSLS